MHMQGTGNPTHMIFPIAIEGAAVFAASADAIGYIYAALITGIFTTVNGLLLAYFQHRWNKRNDRKKAPERTRRIQRSNRSGSRSTDRPGTRPPKRRPNSKD